MQAKLMADIEWPDHHHVNATIGWLMLGDVVEARAAFIGWAEEQRRVRLPRLANNARRRILPESDYPKLISRFMKLMRAPFGRLADRCRRASTHAGTWLMARRRHFGVTLTRTHRPKSRMLRALCQFPNTRLHWSESRCKKPSE